MIADGGVAQDATVDVVEVVVEVRCRGCAATATGPELITTCPGCAGHDLELVAGDDLVLESITLADRDAPGPRGAGGGLMCLGIPGELVELADDDTDLATVSVAGVRRKVNVGLLIEDEELGRRRLDPHPRRLRAGQDRRGRGGRRPGDAAQHGPGLRPGARGVRGLLDREGGTVKYVDEFRDGDTARAIGTRIAALAEPGKRYAFMEVCGGHTHTIYKHGLEDHLPESIRLVHGPGCPVCVLPMGRVDDAIAIARDPDVIMTAFGDMMRVPGSDGSFFDAKAEGADIRMVYSPLDALKIARANPDAPRGVHGHRLRDDHPVDGDDDPAGRARGPRELLGVLQPRRRHPADDRDPRLPRPAPRRLHRARARLDDHRLRALPVHRRPSAASRWWSRGSSRWTSCSRSTS